MHKNINVLFLSCQYVEIFHHTTANSLNIFYCVSHDSTQHFRLLCLWLQKWPRPCNNKQACLIKHRKCSFMTYSNELCIFSLEISTYFMIIYNINLLPGIAYFVEMCFTETVFRLHFVLKTPPRKWLNYA
jgi:hypothetical protein